MSSAKSVKAPAIRCRLEHPPFFGTFARMRYMGLGDIAALSRRFDVFDALRSYDRDLLEARLFPPLPVCGDDLVWGFAILREAWRAGLQELPVADVRQSERLLCALKLENRSGRYTPEEQVSIYTLALEVGAAGDPEQISVAVTGKRGFFQKMERISKLPDYLAAGVNNGRLDIGTAERIAGLPEAACIKAISSNTLSFSQVRHFLMYLDEIRRRDGLGAKETVALADELLAAEDPVDAISTIRNPMLAELKKKFERVRDRYTEHTGLQLTAPANFEGDSFHVSFSFSTRLEFIRKVRKLEKLEEGCEELEELL